MDNVGEGYIKMRVTAVGGTVPVQGAKVVISEYGAGEPGGDEVLFTMRTNASGNTPTVALPAPSMAESLSPGGKRPYSLYAIRVTNDGYYPVELAAVPVFDKVTSLQAVDLLPIGAGDISVDENDGDVMIYEMPGDGYPDGGLGGGGGMNGVVHGGTRGVHGENGGVTDER